MTNGKKYDIIIIENKKEVVRIVIKIILLIIWAYCAIAFYDNYKTLIAQNTKGIGVILCYLWLILTAPIVTINNLVIDIWSWWMPEGWEVGDEEYFLKKHIEQFINQMVEIRMKSNSKDDEEDDKDE